MRALELALSLTVRDGLLICSDSLSGLMAIRHLGLSSACSLVEVNVRRLLLRFARADIRVAFMWVPSHRGIFGNERADAIARASSRGQIDPSLSIDINASSLTRPSARLLPSWQLRWQEVGVVKGRFLFSFSLKGE